MLKESDAQREQSLRTPDEPAFLHEGFMIMLGKLIETGLLVSNCISTGDGFQIDRCATVSSEVHEYEKTLTMELLATKGVDLPDSVIHLPFLLKQIGNKLEDILNCCRLKACAGVLFNGKTEAHVQQLLAILVDMMNNLRDAFAVPDKVLIESIISEGCELDRMLRDFRSAQWLRARTGASAFQATNLYLDIVDAVRSANDELGNICSALLKLGTIATDSSGFPGTADNRNRK